MPFGTHLEKQLQDSALSAHTWSSEHFIFWAQESVKKIIGVPRASQSGPKVGSIARNSRTISVLATCVMKFSFCAWAQEWLRNKTQWSQDHPKHVQHAPMFWLWVPECLQNKTRGSQDHPKQDHCVPITTKSWLLVAAHCSLAFYPKKKVPSLASYSERRAAFFGARPT